MIAVHLPVLDPIQAAPYSSPRHPDAIAIWIRHLHARGLDPATSFDRIERDGVVVGMLRHPTVNRSRCRQADKSSTTGGGITVMDEHDFADRHKPLTTIVDLPIRRSPGAPMTRQGAP